jgi:long-chain acyl-CoA synthetase
VVGAATLCDLAASFASLGDKPALVAFDGEAGIHTSYATLDDRIRRVASGLRCEGIGAGDFVLLWAPNSADWVSAWFGVIASGATAIPLDHQCAVELAVAVVRDANPTLILTTREQKARLAQGLDRPQARFILLDGEAHESSLGAWMAHEPGPIAQVDPGQFASLLYTSGTTGRPKGVPLTHRNLTANLEALLKAELIHERDRVLLPLPLHHTYPFMVGLLLPLATGATVVFPAGVTGPEIMRAASDGKVTALLAVPRLLSALRDGIRAQVSSRGGFASRVFSVLLAVSSAIQRATGLHPGRLLFRQLHARLGGRLRLIGCGGARLDPDLERELEALGWRVLTGYGLTETSPVLTFNRPNAARSGSEGRPLPGVELRIATPQGTEHGEVLAKGPSVFSGYWQDAERTAEAFTFDGWFRTGDLGWLDAEGYLHIAGRSKEVIVLQDGKNVYPEELEKIYAQSRPIREIAVIEHGHGLAALIVPDEQVILERGTLREAAWLREEIEEIAARLPAYQRVAHVRITRDPLPRTQLGKLKRHLLADWFADAENGTGARDATQSQSQSAPAAATDIPPESQAVWQWLARRFPGHRLTLDTSPQFDLEIDSLAWVTLTLELEREFGIALSGDALSGVTSLRDLLRESNTPNRREIAGCRHRNSRHRAVYCALSASCCSRSIACC